MTDAHRLYLLQWLKSDRALMMLFNDGTFQVNTLRKHWLLGKLRGARYWCTAWHSNQISRRGGVGSTFENELGIILKC